MAQKAQEKMEEWKEEILDGEEYDYEYDYEVPKNSSSRTRKSPSRNPSSAKVKKAPTEQ